MLQQPSNFNQCRARTAKFTVPELRMLQVRPLKAHELPSKLNDLVFRHPSSWQARTESELNSTLVLSVAVIVERVTGLRTVDDDGVVELRTFVCKKGVWVVDFTKVARGHGG